jgi:hypothetical protein
MGDRGLVPIKDVACDESGNTGENLLDPTQPVYSLASVVLDDATCRYLLADVLHVGSSEAKFAHISRTESGRQSILELLSHPELAEKTAVYVVHKPFMAIAKIVDVLLETTMHRDGMKWYESGEPVAFANFWFMTIPVLYDSATFETFLMKFVEMMRGRTEADIDSFYSYVVDMVDRNVGGLEETIEMLLFTDPVARDLLQGSRALL